MTATVIDLLMRMGFAESRRAARRLVLQGAVSLDGRKITDPRTYWNLPETATVEIYQGGKWVNDGRIFATP